MCVCVQQGAGSGGMSEMRKSSVTDREQVEKRGSTPEPRRGRDTRSGSMSSQTSRSGLEDSYSANDSARKDSAAQLTQNFCPVTLTVNGCRIITNLKAFQQNACFGLLDQPGTGDCRRRTR